MTTTNLLSQVETFSIADEIDESIAAGKGNATLIPWANVDVLDPQASILEAVQSLETRGWVLCSILVHLERDGWKVWFRSQGQLSPPIAQWSRIA